MKFQIKHLTKKKFKNPILIEGLPGIGNVGKIAVDFLVENLKAKKVMEIHSNSFPHSVFINERNLIDLPVIFIYHQEINKRDFLFIVGDVQPIDEAACYEFCDSILDVLEKYGGSELVTLGGIGLQKIPKKPKVYITGTDKKYIKTFPHTDNKIYGVVGPIIGVTGVLLGRSQLRKMEGAALLAQTFAHPAYLGIKGAKETLKVLNSKFKMKIDLKKLSSEIDEIENEILTRAKAVTEAGTTSTKPVEPNYFG
ncbi:MAG: PAC2 family protein [Nanoarchaeota archaeon]|nr:PAC2 family protein [Nanoarchaeota archaeon]